MSQRRRGIPLYQGGQRVMTPRGPGVVDVETWPGGSRWDPQGQEYIYIVRLASGDRVTFYEEDLDPMGFISNPARTQMDEFDFDGFFDDALEPKTRVVNLRQEPYDVYIGREGKGHDGYFGNPIRTGSPCPVCGRTHRGPQSTIPCFAAWARKRAGEDEVYRARVKALYGLVLGCFCKPKRCHGDTLMQLAEELNS